MKYGHLKKFCFCTLKKRPFNAFFCTYKKLSNDTFFSVTITYVIFQDSTQTRNVIFFHHGKSWFKSSSENSRNILIKAYSVLQAVLTHEFKDNC